MYQTRANAVRHVGMFWNQHETHAGCVEWTLGSKRDKRSGTRGSSMPISGTLHVIKRSLDFVLSDKGSQWGILSKCMYLKDVFKRYHFVSSFQNNLQGSKDSITKTT